MYFGAGIDSVRGAMTTSLVSDAVAELADETILTSRFCMSGEEEARRTIQEVGLEHGGISDVGKVG